MSIPTLRLIAFDGGWNLPIWAAQSQGYFRAEGVDIALEYTPSSAALIAGLADASYDIAMAGADNFIAHHHSTAANGVARAEGGQSELLMFMGGDQGFLSLVGVPEIQAIEALRGKVVGVDSLTTGFAFVARELLERSGLPATEVEFKPFGGTNQRYRALLEKSFDATLLRTPFELLAVEKGFQHLSTASDLGPYQGTVGAARRTWAAENRALLTRFLRAYSRGLQWCLMAGNRGSAEDLLASRVSDLDARTARAALDVLLAPEDGLTRDLRVSKTGLETVLALRGKYTRQLPKNDRAENYFDHSFLSEALS